MPRLHDLRRKKSEIAGELRAKKEELRGLKSAYRQKLEDAPIDAPLGADIKEARERLDACEQAIDDLKASHDDHEDRIKEMERTEAADADAATPLADVLDDRAKGLHAFGHVDADGRITPHGYGEKQAAQALAFDEKKGKGFKAARFVLGVLAAKSVGYAEAANFVERRFGDKAVSTALSKALNTAGVATGGALIPQDFSNEFIELLRAEEVFEACNPTHLPMPLGNLTIPRLAGGATAGFQGELDDIAVSQPTFDDLQLNAKKLTAMVPVSNDLLRRAPAGVESIIRDDMTRVTALRRDLANLIGDGSGGSTIGLLNLAAATQKFIVAPFAAIDNATILTAVNGTLFGMRLALKNAMSRMIRPRWIFAPAVEAFIMALRDQVGNFVYKDEMETGKLLGIPYHTTQQFPTNISTASGTNGTYLFLADFADVIVADTLDVRVDASDVAAYRDQGGNTVSTFARDQTAFRIITEFDMNIRHQASVAVAVLPNWYPAGYTGGAGTSFYLQAPSGDASAAASTWGVAAPSGSNNPANVSANVPGGTLPGRP